ncbi:MAG: hypothetical protein NTW19_12900 [Planctomycetota bacterium]|nr:hypothetical protein [Planctomycetota bacterium]
MTSIIPASPTETRVIVHGPPSIGDLNLWVPEAITTDAGNAAVYPVGEPWTRTCRGWRQRVPASGAIGPGNAPLADPNTFECLGIRFPYEGRVEWETNVEPRDLSETGVDFDIRLRNVGTTPMRKAGAAVCVKFLNRAWWRDEDVLVQSGRQVRSLAELGRDAGQPNGFQAWLVEGESISHRFFHEFWGINRHRLDHPTMVSRNAESGWCSAVHAQHAYMLHSNRGNPCTDILLAFGDLAPGESRLATGKIDFHQGPAEEMLMRVAR